MNRIDDLAVIRPAELCTMLGISRATLYSKIRSDSFPLPIQLGPNSIGFSRSEIEEWIKSRPKGVLPAVTDRHLVRAVV